MSKIILIGIDTAKHVFHLVGIDHQGKYVWRRRLSRTQLIRTLVQMEPCEIVLEACAASHHWARQLSACGHQVRLIAAQHVKPYGGARRTTTGTPRQSFQPLYHRACTLWE